MMGLHSRLLADGQKHPFPSPRHARLSRTGEASDDSAPKRRGSHSCRGSNPIDDREVVHRPNDLGDQRRFVEQRRPLAYVFNEVEPARGEERPEVAQRRELILPPVRSVVDNSVERRTADLVDEGFHSSTPLWSDPAGCDSRAANASEWPPPEPSSNDPSCWWSTTFPARSTWLPSLNCGRTWLRQVLPC